MRKGQAAMEFLMTYGWAILVVLAAIGALAYFGVLSPDRFLPDKCSTTAPFTCGEWRFDKVDATHGNAIMVLTQNTGYDLVYYNINFTTTGLNCNDYEGTTSVENGGKFTANVSGCTIATGAKKFKGDYVISYSVADGSINRTITGSLQTKVE